MSTGIVFNDVCCVCCCCFCMILPCMLYAVLCLLFVVCCVSFSVMDYDLFGFFCCCFLSHFICYVFLILICDWCPRMLYAVYVFYDLLQGVWSMLCMLLLFIASYAVCNVLSVVCTLPFVLFCMLCKSMICGWWSIYLLMCDVCCVCCLWSADSFIFCVLWRSTIRCNTSKCLKLYAELAAACLVW